MNSQRRTFRAPGEPCESGNELNGCTENLNIEFREQEITDTQNRDESTGCTKSLKRRPKTPSQSVETEARTRQEHSSSVETEPRPPQRHSRSIETNRQHSHSTSKLEADAGHLTNASTPKQLRPDANSSKQLQSKAPSTPKNKKTILNRLVDAQEQRSPCHIRTPKREDPNPTSGHLES